MQGLNVKLEMLGSIVSRLGSVNHSTCAHSASLSSLVCNPFSITLLSQMSFFGILINILFKFIFTYNPLLRYHNIE